MTPRTTPPPDPSVVHPWSVGELGLQVHAEPSAVVAGGRVDVFLTTGRHSAGPAAGSTLLDRWDRQRWLPAAGAGPYLGHPAVTPATLGVSAGTTGLLATIDTTALPPGDYRVSGWVYVRDAEQSSGVQGFFTVTG